MLIPDGTSTLAYPDGTTAIPHVVGMFIVRRDGSMEPQHFDAGMDLEIADGTGASCTIDGASGDASVPLHTILKSTGKEYLHAVASPNNHVASVVRFRGGAITTTEQCDGSYEISGVPGTRKINLIFEWTGTHPTATVTLVSRASGKPEPPIPLAAGDKMYIYNFDKAISDEAKFFAHGPAVDNTHDDDFKWHYWLLGDPTGGWNTWLAGSSLPVPRHVSTQQELFAVQGKIDEGNWSPDDGDCIGGYFDIGI